MTLTRIRHKLPDYIRDALNERKLMDAYRDRPDYQQNDYIGWITGAKRDETKQKALGAHLLRAGAGECWMSLKVASCI